MNGNFEINLQNRNKTISEGVNFAQTKVLSIYLTSLNQCKAKQSIAKSISTADSH